MWRKGAIVGAAAVLLVTTATASAQAASSSSQQQQVNNQISQLKNQLNEVSGDESAILGKLDDINNRKAQLDSQISQLQGQMKVVQAQLDDATNTLNQAQQEADQARAALSAAQQALDDSTKELQQQAVNAYVGQDPGDNLSSFMFKAQDMRELTAASEYLHQIVTDQHQVVEQHRELQGQAEDLKKQVDEKQAEAQAAHDTIAQQQAQLASQQSQLNGLEQQVQAEADQQQQLLDQDQSQKATIQQQMDQLQQQSDEIAAQLRAVSGGGTGPAPGKGILSNPVPGAPLSSPFGMRLDPVLNRYQLHAGQDFAVPTGTPIHAAADGTVVTLLSTSQSGGYGNYTCINHGGGLATCYAHQSQFLVTMGQHVSRGQVIGLSGSTGYATGPHLHFEVRINGTPVNPIGYL